MAVILDQDLPPKPSGFPGHYLIWTGNVKRFLKNVINRRNFLSRITIPTCLKLGMGFLQGIKRGCAPVTAAYLQAELVSHVIAMTTPPTHTAHWEYIDEYTGRSWLDVMDYKDGTFNGDPSSYKIKKVWIDPIKDTFSSTCKAILRNTEHEYHPKAHEPSHNACFENPRKTGGAYMEIVTQLGLSLVESGEILAKGKKVKNVSFELPNIDKVLSICRERYLQKNEDSEMLQELQKFGKHFKDYKKLDKMFEKFIDKEYHHTDAYKDKLMVDTTPKTGVIPLSEPLKVRVITKGEALPSYASKSLQKSMKAYINRFPSLVLTTRPLVVEDFRKVWKLEKDLEEKFDLKLVFTEHVSGDYKAATDKLNIDFTKLIFEQFLEALNVPVADRDVYREVLYSQRLYYPKEYSHYLSVHPETKDLGEMRFVPTIGTQPDGRNGYDSFTVKQVNGQLMGSILSFPVLCIANLICYKCALDEYININRKKGEKKRYVNVFNLPVLVNGDDIYFRSNPVFYQIWLKYIDIAGFVLSVGKNYVHKSVFTINSQCFTYNEATDEIYETTFLNVGLLIGQSKSGVIGEKLPIWDLYNKVLKGAYNPVDTHKRFLYYHRDSVAQVSKNGNYNLFLPKDLGGLGFIRPSPAIDVRITAFQRQLATHFLNKIVQNYHKDVTKESLGLSYARLIDENSPKVYDSYQGEPIYYFLKRGEDIPEGYQIPQKKERPPHLMVHYHLEGTGSRLETYDGVQVEVPNVLENMQPKLAFRSITTTALREFRKAERYKGEECWFGFENAVTGQYPYYYVEKDICDTESLEANTRLIEGNRVEPNVLDTFYKLKSFDAYDFKHWKQAMEPDPLLLEDLSRPQADYSSDDEESAF